MPEPTLEEVQDLPDDETLDVEAELIEDTTNAVQPEDGDQPPQDCEPDLVEED